MTDYEPLKAYLERLQVPRIRLTLEEIERVLAQPLPKSAKCHRPFWANQRNVKNRPWARAWQRAGWRVARGGVEFFGTRIVAVSFERTGPGHVPAQRRPHEARETPTVLALPTPNGDGADQGSLRILVVSTCSGSKAVEHPDRLTLQDFADPERLAVRERHLADWRRPALEMYTGREHGTVRRALDVLRAAVAADIQHRIVSAGYGLIRPERRIVPYEATFNAMPPGEVVRWSRHLGIARALEAELREVDLAILLLGTRYVWAVEPRKLVPRAGQRLIFVAAPAQAGRIGSRPGVTLVPASRDEAVRRGTDNYIYKGWLLERLARGLRQRGRAGLGALLSDDSPVSFDDLVDAAA